MGGLASLFAFIIERLSGITTNEAPRGPYKREDPGDGLALHGEGEVGQRQSTQDHNAGADVVHGVAEPTEVQ